MTRKVQRISAYGLLLKDDKILLCRLSQRVMKSAGHWTLPGGGLDFGENPEDALVREFAEETGLTVETGELVAVDSLADEVDGTLFHSIRIIYKAHYISGELQFEEKGSTDACDWFSQSDAAKQQLIALTELGLMHAFA